MKEEYREENTTSSRIEGRHSVLEALRAGSLIERLFVQKGCQDGPVLTILREAKKADVMVDFVPKERLDFMSETKNHQGVVAVLSAFAYSTIDDMFALAEKKGEAPFFFLLDGIEDPHNLGAIIRTANLAGAHGVIPVSYTHLDVYKRQLLYKVPSLTVSPSERLASQVNVVSLSSVNGTLYVADSSTV